MNESDKNDNQIETSDSIEITKVETSDNKESENNASLSDNVKHRLKRGWLFYLKVVGVFCLLMAVSFGIAIFYFFNKLTSDSNFEKFVNQKASEITNMNVNFEKINVSFPSIELKNIHIATDSATMKLDSNIALVKIRPDLIGILRGTNFIDYLNVSSSTTYLEMKAGSNKDASINKGKEASSSLDLSSVVFPFKSIDLLQITLNFVDGASKTNYDIKLNRASLSRSIISSAMPFDIDGEWVGKVALNAKGDVNWPNKVVSELNAKVKDINEIRNFIPKEYRSYTNNITNSNARASLEYDIKENSINIKNYNVDVEPILNVSGNASIPQMSPLKLQASATVSPIEVSNIWPMVKDFVPAEYGLSLNRGSVGSKIGINLDGDKPLGLYVLAQPQTIEVKTKYLSDKIVLKKGNIGYDGNKVSVSDVEVGLSDTAIKLNSLTLSLSDLSLNTVFGINLGIEGLLNNLKDYVSDGMKNLDIKGNISFEGNANGKLSNISSLKLNGAIISKLISVTEKATKAKGTIENLNLRLDSVGAETGSFSLESLRIAATGADLKVSGVVKNQKYIGFDCIANGTINVDEFSKLASGLFNLPVKEGQYRGQLDVSLKLGGDVKEPKPYGKIVANNLYADVSEYGMVVENLNGTITADNNKLMWDNIKAKLLGGDFYLNGTLNDFNNMKIEAVANIRDTDLAMVRKLIGVNVPEMPAELDFSGRADLNASLKGSTSAPSIKGSAVIKEGRFFHPIAFRPVEKINGRVNFDNGGLSSNGLTAYWGKSKVNLLGNIKDWAKFITNFKFDVSPLDVTDAAGFFLDGTGFKVLGAGIGNGTITGAIEKIKVDCVANVGVGTVTAVIMEGGDTMKFPYQNLTARAIYHDSKLNISSASLNLFDGDIKAKGNIYLASEPIKFDVDAKINNLQTQEFLKVNADKKYEKTLVGGLDGTAVLKGDTTGLNSINGVAKIGMASGTYDSPDIIKKIADKINNPSLASGTIRNVNGDYNIANGRISSNNVMGTSNDNKVSYVGSVGLDTTLDGSLNVVLGKETCSKSSYLKGMLGNSQNLSFSCKVKGPITSPNIDLPLDSLVKQKAKSEINKLLGKNGDSGDKAKVKDKINEGVSKLGKSLKKIFK